jgi:recombination protein RecA
VKVVKNKMAAPFREAEFDVAYGQGISRAGELIDLGVEAGVLEKSGAWIGYGGERLGNGREAARQHLLEHQELLKEIRGKLLAHAGIGAAPAPVATVATPAATPATKKAA